MTASNDSAFYLSEYSSKDSSSETKDHNGFVPTPGLVELDFSSGNWTNDTDTRQLPLSGTFMWGALEAVPFGPNELLVMFGGRYVQQNIVCARRQYNVHERNHSA